MWPVFWFLLSLLLPRQAPAPRPITPVVPVAPVAPPEPVAIPIRVLGLAAFRMRYDDVHFVGWPTLDCTAALPVWSVFPEGLPE